MNLESSSPYPQVPAIKLRLRDTSSRNTLPPEIEWGSSLPPDYFVSRGSISTWVTFNIRFLWRGVVSTSPNSQAGVPPLVGCPRLLIQFNHSYTPYRRPFLHPQPEEAPCRGDRDPHSKRSTFHNPTFALMFIVYCLNIAPKLFVKNSLVTISTDVCLSLPICMLTGRWADSAMLLGLPQENQCN
jgi:hypothetical protein